MTALVEDLVTTGRGRLTPRPHQQAALDAAAAVFAAGGPRAQLRMACGTGKTLIGPWLAQRLGARTVAVFTPSIALVAQTLGEWRAALGSVRVIAVCSDPSSAAGRAEIGVDGVDPFAGRHDVTGRVTTRAEVLAGFLDHPGPDGVGVSVVVSTYHSAPVLAAALRLSQRCGGVDLLVADEAHHLAGRADARFLPVLRDSGIAARWRLFTTATPVVVGNLTAADPLDELSGAGERIRCMDDTALFGPVTHTLGVGEAVERGLLADYRVVVTTPTTPASGPPAGVVGVAQRAALAALVDVAARYGLRRVLTFHNRVTAAREFAARLNALQDIGGVEVRAFPVDGSMPDQKRRAVLDELADSRSGRAITVVCSAQCLREGIDVPAVDAVLFADPRTSQVGIIQAIGRALRTHPGKTVGTIVIPLVLDPDGDDQEQLADSAYTHVWRVLRGLRAHDARVGFDLDRARAAVGRTGAVDPADIGWLHVLGDDPGAVVARLLQHTSAMWEHFYGQLSAEAEKLGSAANITTTTSRLGGWITLQRILHRDGVIDPDRARRLEAVPGWHWQAGRAADERALAVVAQLAAEHGSLADHSVYAGRADGLGRPLAFWVAAQLCAYRDGQLPDWLRGGLEALAGWTWEPLTPDDTIGVDAYRSFVAWEQHTDIPAGHVEDDVPVGAWLRGVRRRRIFGTLPALLEAMLLVCAPTGPAGERRLAWRPSQTWWDIGMDAARRHIARRGTLAGLAVGQTEIVDGHEIDLYGWVTRTRACYHRGKLAAEYAAQAEKLPGWVWRATRGGRRHVAADDQPKPGVEHGHRGYQAGCRCTVCVSAKRAYHRAAAAARREDYRADWIDAADVRAHLHGLLALDAGKARSEACFTPGAIAAAAGVPLGLVRKLVAAEGVPRCHQLHRRALLAVTADDVRAVRCVPRARGRKGIHGQNQPVDDPAPTWRILDELAAAGWSTPMLAAALGYTSASKLPRSGQPVSVAHAKMVRLLHESLDGDLTPPPAPPQRRRRADGRPVNRPDTAAEQRARELLSQGHPIPHIAAHTGLSAGVVAALHATRQEAS